MLLAVVVGALSWSLAEYLIHRFAGHSRFAKRNPFGVEHTQHHARGHYFAPWWKKALFALGFLALVAPVAILAAGPASGLAYAAGLVAAYLGYEAQHRLLHVRAGHGPYARWARRHHFHHHFVDPGTNHGVTSPIWDLVFGTYRAPTRIPVPPKLAMRWLCDPASGEVFSHLAADYALRRAPDRLPGASEP